MTIQSLRHILIFQILVGFPVLLGIHLMAAHGIAIPDLLWSYDAEGYTSCFMNGDQKNANDTGSSLFWTFFCIYQDILFFS